MSKKNVVSVRLTEAECSKVDEAASRYRVNRSAVLRWWVEEMPERYVPRHMNNVKKGRKHAVQ